jgi:hypothetical protein
MKPLYLAVVALSLTAAVAHAQPAPADGASNRRTAPKPSRPQAVSIVRNRSRKIRTPAWAPSASATSTSAAEHDAASSWPGRRARIVRIACARARRAGRSLQPHCPSRRFD